MSDINFNGDEKKPSLLHLSYDLRDRNNKPVTPAVRNLIAETEKITDIQIIDLLRVPHFKDELLQLNSKHHLMVNSFGLPLGIFLISSLRRTFNRIISAENSGIIDLSSVSVIHAHKATFEGYIAYLLSKKFNTRLIITLRQTDAWIFRRRPDLIRHFKPVFERSDKIIYLIPHITKLMRKYLGEDFYSQHIKNKLEFIPNIVERKITVQKKQELNDYFMTALRMNFKSVWRKNLNRLFKSIKLLNDDKYKLIVIGDGKSLPRVKNWAKKYKIENNINFKGNVPNNEMDHYYGSSIAFLMPSTSESFGLVYAESLLNGTPIMYSKDCMGFDGIFEGVGVGVNPFSVKSIADGIQDLMKNHSSYRKTIERLQSEGKFEIFSSAKVRKKYSDIISLL